MWWLLIPAVGIGASILLSKEKEPKPATTFPATPQLPTATAVEPSRPTDTTKCVFIGVQRTFLPLPGVVTYKETDWTIRYVPTGEIVLKGTKSEFAARAVWACPPGVLPPPESIRRGK